MHRKPKMVPLEAASKREVKLSPGAHSDLIRAVWEAFVPRFVPGGELIYIGDTGSKWSYFDNARLSSLGVTIGNHGKSWETEVWIADSPTHLIHFNGSRLLEPCQQ